MPRSQPASEVIGSELTRVSRPTPPPTRRVARSGGQRLDIQGLRAVAVLVVVAYHLSPSRLTGGYVGVDVFFVISGFLITSHLLQSRLETGRNLVTFWGRRIRRLLPAALVVLACTLVATLVLAPDGRWLETARHVLASGLYIENWRLAADSTSYLKAENAPTPVQHYWSLSVEEQFYLVWPIMLLLVTRLARARGWAAGRAVAIAVTGAAASSFAFSVYETSANPSVAYFSTPVRLWELAAGGLLAVAAASSVRWEARRALWPVLGLVGLLAIVVASMTFSDSTPFPGWQATLPVGGAVLVLAAGCWGRRGAADRLLSLQPLPFIGDISYSIYLWHWPLIVLLPFVSGSLGPLDKVAILVASIGLAWLTKMTIEDPFRRPGITWVGRAPFRFALVGMLVMVLGSTAVTQVMDHRVADQRAQAAAELRAAGPCLGAGTLALGPTRCPDRGKDPIPAPAQAQLDRSALYNRSCFVEPPFDPVRRCTYGDPNAKISVALVGNSHAGMWFTALQELMGTEHFKVTSFVADGCNVTTARLHYDPWSWGTGCLAWGENVMKATTDGSFDVVVTSAIQTRAPEAAQDDYPQRFPLARKGHLDELRRWDAAGVRVLVIRDTPRAPKDVGPVPDCVAARPTDLRKCSGSRASWVPEDPLAAAAESMDTPHVSVVDLTDKLCDETTCYGVVGGVIAYYDRHHLTQTMVRTLTPYIRGPLQALIKDADRAS